MYNKIWIKFLCNSNLLVRINDGVAFLKNKFIEFADQINDSTNKQINIH